MSIPILILAYKRKEKTKVLLEKIKQYKPKKVYIAVDGPKDSYEIDQINEVNELFDDFIDWDCEVQKRNLNINLGTHYGIETAIDWFFSKEKRGIILEDDCLPTESFFNFMEHILLKHEHDESVMSVSGHNCGVTLNSRCYYSSTLPMTWGWGTWARAWKKYDRSLKNVYRNKENYIHNLLELSGNNYAYVVKRLIELELVSQNKVAAWDYRWFAAVHVNKGLTIFPPVNLITNVGFDEFATHTNNQDSPVARISQHDLTLSVNDMILDNNHSNAFWQKYISDRISLRDIQNYVLKKVLQETSINIKGAYSSIFILGAKDLGKMLYSQLSLRYKIDGFCGRDVVLNEVDKLMNKQIVDKEILIISSIEGEHENKIIVEYKKYFTVISWRELLAGDEAIDTYIRNHFTRWVNEGLFNN